MRHDLGVLFEESGTCSGKQVTCNGVLSSLLDAAFSPKDVMELFPSLDTIELESVRSTRVEAPEMVESREDLAVVGESSTSVMMTLLL